MHVADAGTHTHTRAGTHANRYNYCSTICIMIIGFYCVRFRCMQTFHYPNIENHVRRSRRRHLPGYRYLKTTDSHDRPKKGKKKKKKIRRIAALVCASIRMNLLRATQTTMTTTTTPKVFDFWPTNFECAV